MFYSRDVKFRRKYCRGQHCHFLLDIEDLTQDEQYRRDTTFFSPFLYPVSDAGWSATVWTILWKTRLQSSLKVSATSDRPLLSDVQYYQPRLASENSLVIKKNPLYFSLVSNSLEGHNALKQTHLHQLVRSVSCHSSLAHSNK